MTRPLWGSRLGFIFAVAGSAVGLANIWRFPYIVGQYGGSAFIIVYLLCLFLIGFPVFMAEMLIGRTAQTSPSGAFRLLGGKLAWSWAGKLTILTGFIVSSFYSAIAGWVLGYLVEAVQGNLSNFTSATQVADHHRSLMNNPLWGLSFHFCFLLICIGILYLGVRNGIERGNKIMMPLLFLVLLYLVGTGLKMPNAQLGLEFLLKPDWSLLTPTAILAALGQSFFTLSIGQGTIVTYGSYLKPDENLVKSSYPVVIMDTLVSLLSAVAVFTIVFSVDLKPDQGSGLIFHTLPWVFSHLPGGHFLASMFFLLVVLAATTSEISAMEPTIAYLMDEWGWKRRQAVLICGLGAFLVGIPSALSSSILADVRWQGMTFLALTDFVANAILIPVGGFLAIILVGWVWGTTHSLNSLKLGSSHFFDNHPWLLHYFRFCFKIMSPILIIFVFLNALGFFS
ncbi:MULTISPECIES: sodium-dependent transporter [unclassified Neochlamydia]|uniref:sodium-dependent transporter n=1 Tax=unclassified Neochlamydia TaxID=2643326 RepID=UPI00140DC46A|nr:MULTISPECIES: sodium-dependent transporter [unclassified Neochlamydia]MBS4171559.1 putative sodium-dependent transporter YocR [Neochlamydia sp. AcF95]NGY95946.1 putative sodium-dependent transporter YocR [Neochlamydia sp. AcF84]